MQNFLQQSQVDGSYQLRVKIKYLQGEKEKLQLSNSQMYQNITLLRDVNRELYKLCNTKLQHPLIQKLNQQNALLESSYLRILNQNKQLICKSLMLQQIIQEGEVQQHQVLKEYQSKIAELRRSIHFKQSCIQSYQQNSNSNNTFCIPNIPTSNINIILFNQIDNYKNQLQQLQVRNKQLQKDKQSLTLKVNKLQNQKTLMESLIKSREGYNQLRNRLINEKVIQNCLALSEGKLPRSTKEKVELNLKLKSDINSTDDKKPTMKYEPIMKKDEKSTFLSASNNVQQISTQITAGNIKFTELQQQLKKCYVELSKLNKAYKKEHQKRKEFEQKVRVLVNSNKFYKQKRTDNTDELNYYKNTTTDLLKLIQHKKVTRTYSVDKTQIQNIIASIKLPKQTPPQISDKQHWKLIQKEIHQSLSQKSQLQLQIINQRKLKRSLSDIISYVDLHPQKKHSQIKCHKHHHKHLKQDHQINQKYQKEVKKQTSNPSRKELDDFSRILRLGVKGQDFDEQTFIIKPKMTYADRKKQKTRHPNLHDFTIIAQNIL